MAGSVENEDGDDSRMTKTTFVILSAAFVFMVLLFFFFLPEIDQFDVHLRYDNDDPVDALKNNRYECRIDFLEYHGDDVEAGICQ